MKKGKMDAYYLFVRIAQRGAEEWTVGLHRFAEAVASFRTQLSWWFSIKKHEVNIKFPSIPGFRNAGPTLTDVRFQISTAL